MASGRVNFSRGRFGQKPPQRNSQNSGRNLKRSFRGGKVDRIDHSRFINKTIIEEKVEKFIPTHCFVDFAVDVRLKANIIKKGYVLPTPIQDRVIPHVLNGNDVVGIANTGTGKTAAFLIPLVNKVIANKNENVLIVVPTRELAIQIEQELKDFIAEMQLYSAVIVGGVPIRKQIKDLKYRNEFIIGTPGRIKNMIEEKYLNLSEFNTVVLDEADRMLDMGFINDMRFMMQKMPKSRHTLFFSATLSKEIEVLIKEFLHEPIMVSVKVRDTAKNIDQDIVKVARGTDKLDVLHDLLNKAEFNKVLIFGRTKHGVEKLSTNLVERGFKAESIHGNKNQFGRQRALGLFKENKVQILVATDVAARGLDISDVSHVINFDIPATYEDYVHRIGRTGRAGKAGKALTFVE